MHELFIVITCLIVTCRGTNVADRPLAHPAMGATHAGTTLVLGSDPATLTNLSGRALARGTPRARHLTRPLVPSPHPEQPAAG